jgi:proteasome-associated ATPase
VDRRQVDGVEPHARAHRPADGEELILEEVPDTSYHDIGGLTRQIEQIRDAIELPYLHADLFR